MRLTSVAGRPGVPGGVGAAAPPRWLWPVLVAAHTLALGYQLRAGHWFFPDSDRYLAAAVNLWRHGTLYAGPWPTNGVYVPLEYSIRPPGYPAFLLLCGLWVPAVLFAQNLLSLLNLRLVAGWLAAHAPMTKRRWRLFLLLLLTAPAQLIYASALMSELVLQSLVVGLWLLLTAYWRQGRGRSLLGAAGLASAALLAKPVFYPFAAVLVLVPVGRWVALRFVPRRAPALVEPAQNPASRQAAHLVLAALPLLVALAWQGRNATHTGYFHFSAIADINLLHYNAYATLRATVGPAAADSAVEAVETAAARQPTYAAQQAYTKSAASALLRQHAGAYLALHTRGMLNCLLDPGRFDFARFFGLPTPESAGLLRAFDSGGYAGLTRALASQPWLLLLALAGVLAGNLARLLLFLAFLGTPTLPARARWLAGGLVFYVVGLTGPLGASRFLVPVLPLLLLGTGTAWPLRRRPVARPAAAAN